MRGGNHEGFAYKWLIIPALAWLMKRLFVHV